MQSKRKILNKYYQKRNCTATVPPLFFFYYFHIHVSVSDLYIPSIDLRILLQENVGRSWEYINRSQTHECGNLD
jgi:hypothetical protein